MPPFVSATGVADMIRYLLIALSMALIAAPAAAAPQPNSVKTQTITIDPTTAPKPNTPDSAGKSDAQADPDTKPSETKDDPTQPSDAAAGDDAETAEIPEVHYGDAELPAPVKRTRDALIEAARSGDVEELRPVLEMNEVMPTLSFGDITDPIEHLKKTSGDGEGREVLAILVEVLEAGWVHMDKGKPQEMYIWPYFAQYPLDKLTGAQLVELFEVVTAYDYNEMQTYGAYIFYRVGIGPDGTLHYFVAGD